MAKRKKNPRAHTRGLKACQCVKVSSVCVTSTMYIKEKWLHSNKQHLLLLKSNLTPFFKRFILNATPSQIYRKKRGRNAFKSRNTLDPHWPTHTLITGIKTNWWRNKVTTGGGSGRQVQVPDLQVTCSLGRVWGTTNRRGGGGWESEVTGGRARRRWTSGRRRAWRSECTSNVAVAPSVQQQYHTHTHTHANWR